MRQYEYDGSVTQQNDVICYAFSPDLLEASEKELKSFLQTLCRHFPKTENGEGGYKPMENQALLETFNSAHRYVCELIRTKRAQKRHWWIFAVSFATLVVLSLTLAHSVYVQNSEADQSGTALNQAMHATSA